MLRANQDTFKNLTELSDDGLTFANLLTIDTEMQINATYRKALGDAFGAGLLEEDFKHNNVKATNELNDWVKTVTKGKIPTLFDSPLDPDTGAVIMNALHLKANWTYQFQKGNNFEAPFYLPDGKQKNVTYMKIKARHLENAEFKQYFGWSLVRIPFGKDQRLWFSIILPEGPPQPHFDCCTSFTHLIREAQRRKIDLTLPKFKISQTHHNLVDALKSMDVHDLFDQSTADLSGIDNKRDLYVGDIAHKTTLEIDETGAEGAAATAVVMPHITSAIMHPEEVPAIPFIVDRPFMVVISDKKTNLDFFTALIHEP